MRRIYLNRAPLSIKRGILPTDHFTIISNAWLRDETLPWAARGLLCWLASHAAGYDITEDTIVAAGPSGRDAVRTMLQALEEAGYLRRDRAPLAAGGTSVEYVLIDPRGLENPTLARVGKSNPGPDQAEQPVSAGLPRVGKSDPPSTYLEDQKKTKKTSSSTTATRIPEGFMPTEEMRRWFADEKLAAVIDGRIEHAKFVDYWLGAPGVKGRKHDWPATWRNWMRTAAERAGRQPGNALVPISGAPYKPSTTDQRISQGMALAAKYREQGL